MATVRDRSPGAVTGAGEPARQVELAIGGMTCASCAARIERKLNRLDGVSATVNYATEKARVSYADGVTPEDLVATVVHTGYTAELARSKSTLGKSTQSKSTQGKSTQPEADHPETSPGDDEIHALRDRLVGSAVLAIQVIAMAMV
ncbi:MAG: cation transporter, partial [Pseudonocardiaceae bacterium]